MNVHLRKRQLRVNDLTQDLSDGIMLIQLVEVLTGQQCMMNYNKAPRMDIQKVENVAIALQFIGNFTKVNVNPKGTILYQNFILQNFFLIFIFIFLFFVELFWGMENY